MLENEVNNEIRKRDDAKYLKRDKSNNIVLTQGQYDLVTNEVGQYASAYAWITLKNTQSQCLVKNFVYNSTMGAYDEFIKRNGKDGIEICKYNNLIVPYIGSEIFGIDTVKYFFAKFAKGKQKIPTNPQIEYLITLDEKANGEEVWEGFNILTKDTVIFSKRLNEIKKFLELRQIPSHRVQEILDEFVRQEIFKKSVNYTDNHNANWSLGIDGKKVRLFPAYDFDFCSGIRNTKRIETLCDNGLMNLNSLIKQYMDLPWMKEYLAEVIRNYDMNVVFEKVREKTLLDIPSNIKEYFENTYSKKKKEIETIYSEIFEEKKQGDDEICI